jgi:EpsI family protein
MRGRRYWPMLAILVCAGVALRALSHGEAVVPARPLSELPMEIAGWTGTNLELEQKVVEAVAVNDYVARLYERQGAQPLVLYVGYYRSQRTGQTIHSPKNCLPGAGWEPVESSRVSLHPAGMPAAKVNLYVIEKGLDRQLVLYWYQSHGKIIASEYVGKLNMVVDAIRLNRTDSALVRLSIPIGKDPQAARTAAVRFAEQLLPELNRAIPQ